MRQDGEGRGWSLLAGIAIGAGVMSALGWALDAGKRHQFRDKARHWYKVGSREFRKKASFHAKDVYGHLQETRARVREGTVPDEILEERVKAQIGHVLRRHGVSIHARDGHVTVDGPVLLGEKEKLADRLRRTRGVRSFDLRVREQVNSPRWRAS